MWLSAWKRKIIPLNDDEIKFEMEEDIGLYNEIKKLPKKYRVVIHLFYYEQYKIKDISQILNQKESTIRTWLTRARKLLKNQIKEEDFNV
jgi:RNA polymerase sigma-70 factor (ECF subfamily)